MHQVNATVLFLETLLILNIFDGNDDSGEHDKNEYCGGDPVAGLALLEDGLSENLHDDDANEAEDVYTLLLPLAMASLLLYNISQVGNFFVSFGVAS